jgi:ATP-dependent helicase STH1/SNF2
MVFWQTKWYVHRAPPTVGVVTILISTHRFSHLQGLGKTIQTLALITYLIEKKDINGPFLVIVPLSTITNWQSEFNRWAPSVKTIVLKGAPATRKVLLDQIKRVGEWQVVLTTYEYITRQAEAQVMSKIKWHHMIIDEGHRMKNAKSKLALTLNEKYSTKYRLILTGTPLQVSTFHGGGRRDLTVS